MQVAQPDVELLWKLLENAPGTEVTVDLTDKTVRADELVVQHTATFDEELFATPAVLDGTIYLRTKTTLWAFGEKKK